MIVIICIFAGQFYGHIYSHRSQDAVGPVQGTWVKCYIFEVWEGVVSMPLLPVTRSLPLTLAHVVGECNSFVLKPGDAAQPLNATNVLKQSTCKV